MELAAKQNNVAAVPKKTNSFFQKKAEPSFFSPVFIQPKLTVGPADDIYEREADTVAERVMRMPDPTSVETFFPASQPISKIQRQCNSCEAEERLQRMENEEEDLIQSKPDRQFDIQRQCASCDQEDKMIQPKRLIQRRCVECEDEDHQVQTKRDGYTQINRNGLLVQRKCAACENEAHAMQPKSKFALQRKAYDPLIQRKCAMCEEDEDHISRKESAASSTPQVTPSVNNVLNSPGQTLDRSTRSFMESRFGYDFGGVRIHNDVFAQQSSKDIHALAYTHGEHVVFGAGQYQPDTIEGKKLLAHELTHVVQQGKTKTPDGIQRQPQGSASYNMPFNSAPLEKYSIEIENKYRQLYNRTRNDYYSKAASFIRKCRIEGICDKILTIQEVDDLFGIAKNNGFETSTAAVIDKIPVPLKLKLVTLVISDLIDFAAFQKEFLDAGFVILDDPLAVCIEGCHHLSEMSDFQVLPDCNEPSPEELKRGSEQEYELKGTQAFNPTGDLATYIIYNLKTKKNVTIKVRFGDLSRGVITLTKKFIGGFNDPIKSFNSSNSFGNINEDGCISLFDNEHKESSGTNILPLHHPVLNINSEKRKMALRVRIDEETIAGEIGVMDGAITDFTNAVRNEFHFHANREDLVPAVFGENHAGEKFEGLFYNQLESGRLILFMQGILSAANQQKISATFATNDESHYWFGTIASEIAGAETYALQLKRTGEAYLSGESQQLHLNGEWTGKGFKAKAGLTITYSNGQLSARGYATYDDKNGRGKGDVTIVLTDRPNADRLFKEHLPVGAPDLPNKDPFLDSNLPDPNFPLALTAWGNIDFIVTGKVFVLTGVAAFVVNPEGYIITAGTLKLKKDYQLTTPFGKTIPVFPRKSMSLFNAQFFAVNVDISASANMDVCYEVGALFFKELIASGYYSNHKDYIDEFNLTGVFDIDANFGANINAAVTATLRAGFRDLGYTLANASFTVDMGLCLETHTRAKPTINISGPKENHEYTIKGNLNILALMEFILKVGFKMGLLKDDKDEEGNVTDHNEWKKELLSKRWVLGTWELNFDFSYLLGSNEWPKFKYSGVSLDKSDFLERLFESGRTRGRDLLKGGGFKEDGKAKGPATQDKPFDPLHLETDPIGPFAQTDSFAMNGQPHTLYLEISGTEGIPVADIQMASPVRRKLLPQLIDELALVNEELKVARGLSANHDFSETQVTKLQEAISKLQRAKTDVEREITDAVRRAVNGEMAETGLDAIGDDLTDYANISGTTDLGQRAASPGGPRITPLPTPTPSGRDSFKSPPPGVDVQLILPPEKGVYLETYRQYVKRELLFHSLHRSTRDTNQQTKWDKSQKESMFSKVKCLGVSLGLMEASGDEKARNILRPYWTRTAKLPLDRAGQQRRMGVDHVVEWQVRPLTNSDWIDEPANFELLEPSANSSAGTVLDDNIEQERRDLARRTNDMSWTRDDIRFTKVVSQGNNLPERYSYDDIEKGKHLNDYKKIFKTEKDKEAYDECMKNGGTPF